MVSWPTSPIHRSWVERSNENRHGLRSPYIHTSGAPSTPSANGLSGGIAYGCPSGPVCAGSMRRMSPSRSFGFWPVLVRIAFAAAVTHRPVQESVGADDEVAAVVVGCEVGDDEHGATRVDGVDAVAVHRELVELLVLVAVGVRDVHRVTVGAEHEPEESLLTARRHIARDVEHRLVVECERVRRRCRARDPAHAALLLGHVEARVARACRQGGRARHRSDRRESKLQLREVGALSRHGRGRDRSAHRQVLAGQRSHGEEADDEQERGEEDSDSDPTTHDRADASVHRATRISPSWVTDTTRSPCSV